MVRTNALSKRFYSWNVFALSIYTASLSAQTFEYTQTENGTNQVALGFPVPIPVNSLTPVDGFRTYGALDARHEQLTEQFTTLAARHDLGETFQGRTIWGYQLSDSDANKHSGGIEASALINGGIHAREWQSPESVTGFMEFLLERGGDNHIHQYILENLNLVIIPVLNIDGFIQTQRYPSLVTSSAQTPRDGRMRRKNMNGVDDDLETTNDNLLGVDLNRNNDPWWATSERSSSVTSSIVHHGSGPASEPETQALQNGAILAGEQQLALYMDVHSFTQIYFAPNTGLNTRDVQAQNIASVMRQANNFKYRYGPSNAGGGIGSTDEYFAYTYQVPSYTLEIEPRNSSADYGGNGVSHDGFILPESEVTRMRMETAEATFSGLYAVADVPVLLSLEILDEENQSQVQLDWQNGETERALQTTVENSLAANTKYSLRLRFSKPMRAIEDSFFSEFTGVAQPNITMRYILNNTELTTELNAAAGVWATEDGAYARYQTDTFELQFTTPQDLDWDNLQGLGFELSTTDMSGNQLDNAPGTYAFWRNGAWQNYEGSNNLGGTDSNMVLVEFQHITPPPTTPVTPTTPPTPTSSSGGGSSGYLLLILLGGMLRRFRKHKM